MFTRYKEYCEKKANSQSKIAISIDDYKEQLTTNISGLVLKNSDNNQCVKNFIDVTNIKSKLEKVDYPYVESFIICLENSNITKISNQVENLERWLYLNSKDDSVIPLIESVVYTYQSNMIRKKLDPKDIDDIVEGLCCKTLDVMREMVFNLEREIEKIEWDHHPINFTAVYKENRASEEATVTIGENYHVVFDFKKTDRGFLVENIVFSEMPSSMRSQIDSLLQRIKESPKIKKIITLYMNKPQEERNLFEKKKRDISLGIKTTLPKNTLLRNMPISESEDIWKVRLRQDKLTKVLNEGDFIEYQLLDDVDIIWIKLLEK